MTIHLAYGGRQTGPHPEEEVRRWVEQGALPADALYWREGMAEWRPLRELVGGGTEPGYRLGTPIPLKPAFSREIVSFSRVLTGFLTASAVFAALQIPLSLFLISDLRRNGASEELRLSDGLTAGGACVTGLVYLTCVVLFMIWNYRAHVNVRGFGASFPYKPGWAVGWFFIPFLNLYRPFTATKELFQASADPLQPYTQSAPAMLGWWWGCWLLTNFLSNVSLRLSIQMPGTEGQIASAGFDIASSLVHIPAAWLAVRLVQEITRLQKSWVDSAEARAGA